MTDAGTLSSTVTLAVAPFSEAVNEPGPKVTVDNTSALVVAFAMLEASLVPTELMAETR